MALTPPLGEADYEELRARISELDEADRLIEQSIRGGLDMTEQRKRSREIREQLLKMKNSFWPGRP